MSASIDWTVWQNPTVAERFARGRRAAIPGVATQFELTLRLLARVPHLQRILDLGCGDGVLAQVILDAHPHASAVLLDGSPAMLDLARTRFERASDRVTFVQQSFADRDWARSLPAGRFDAIVSSFAIHHIEDDAKRALYAEVFELLNPGGAFVNIEHVASRSDWAHAMFYDDLTSRIAAHESAHGRSITPSEVLRDMNANGELDSNRLSPLELQLDWLREIGFRDVDCFWKHLELALFAGFKP